MIPHSIPVRSRHCLAAAALLLAPGISGATDCLTFGAGQPIGQVSLSAIKEASGLAAGRRNPGVMWTQNDGNKKKIYALNYGGDHLATFDFGLAVEDVEEIAIGAGPVSGTSYLYAADIGGRSGVGGVRNQIRILRMPEPAVDTAWAGSPVTEDFQNVESITMTYPDGSYDAEAIMVDPVTAEMLLFTKTNGSSRVYRTDLNAAADGASVVLEYVLTIPFSEPSAATVSSDGGILLIRRESAAVLWSRAAGEPMHAALSRPSITTPVVGTPLEPNGEAIAFLPDSTGYLTVSEGSEPGVFFFQAQCPSAPVFRVFPQSRAAFAGSTVRIEAMASGYPAPAYSWKFNGQTVSGQTGPVLQLPAVNAANEGTYEITAVNSGGTVSASAVLTVRPKPDLRITEVQSQPAAGIGADWWELTSFESVGVDLSGWRFNDDGGDLDNSFTMPQGLMIAPGESVVFVDTRSAADFRMWWGNIPADVQIVTYTGGGLAFGPNGDTIRLWNESATDVTDTVTSQIFGAATSGVTFNFNPATRQFGGISQAGVNGVFQSATATDIGSPGAWLPPVAVPHLNLIEKPGALRIEFPVNLGRRYTLEASDDLSEESWAPTGDTFQASADSTGSFERPRSGITRRFYRIRIR